MKTNTAFRKSMGAVLAFLATHVLAWGLLGGRAEAAPYAKLQTGGYAGFVTVGAGYGLFEDLWRNELLYGYVPESVGGVPIHGFTYKTDLAMPSLEMASGMDWIPAYAGGGLLYATSRRVFARLPEEYPDKYYPSTALFWEFHAGTEFTFLESGVGDGLKLHHGAFLEANMHELAFLALYDNSRYFGPEHLFTYTVGYKVRF